MANNTGRVTALQELQSRTILVLEQHLHSEHKPHIVYIGTRLILINLQDIQYLWYTRRPLDFYDFYDIYVVVSYSTQVSTLQPWWACNAPFAWLRAHSAVHQQWAHIHTSLSGVWETLFLTGTGTGRLQTKEHLLCKTNFDWDWLIETYVLESIPTGS